MGGRALMVILPGIIAISFTIFDAITDSTKSIARNVDRYFERQTAQNIAQSGVNLGLRRLADDQTWRAGVPLMDMAGGKVAVAAADTTFMGREVVRITGIGILGYGSAQERRDTSIAYARRGYLPGAASAAITTNNPVTTLGTLTVDGRDHNLSGTLLGSTGVPGIWTTQTFAQGGSSKVGGTASGTDYLPAKPGDPNVIKTNQTWPGGYPTSPDSVLGGADYGFPEGTLKAIAQSGIGGSQYVTNPALLTLPFRGVTYVELPSGGTWQDMIVNGEGILIVHNTARNAIMKNLTAGTFRGLIIADDIVHIHSTILGAVVGLTSSPSSGNCIGNGSGFALFSREAVARATGSAIDAAGNGSSARVIAWKE